MAILVQTDRKKVATVAQITSFIAIDIQKCIYERTTHRSLKQIVYRSRKPRWVPFLLSDMKVQLAKDHKNYTTGYWTQVA